MEIEIKARLTNKAAVMEKLRALGCVFPEPKVQDDTVFAEKTGSLKVFLSNDVFLRIRIQNGSTVILTAKKPKAKSGRSGLVKHEYEIVADSADQARGMLALMGFEEQVRTIKTRMTSAYNGYEICIDDVKGLGLFIELEKMGDAKQAPRIQKEMADFLATLNISPNDFVNKGYDILGLEKQK